MTDALTLSPLGHTWLIDLDGCVLAHNGHLREAERLLPGVQQFWAQIPLGDRIVLLTSRGEEHAPETRRTLERFGLRHDLILFGLPFGERILVNDRKPSGLITAYAVNLARDVGPQDLRITIDPAR